MKLIFIFILIILIVLVYLSTASVKESTILRVINYIIKKNVMTEELKDKIEALFYSILHTDKVDYNITGSSSFIEQIYFITKESTVDNMVENIRSYVVDYMNRK